MTPWQMRWPHTRHGGEGSAGRDRRRPSSSLRLDKRGATTGQFSRQGALGAVAVEQALGSGQLPGYVLRVVADRPVRAPERHVRGVRPQPMRLDERFDPVPDLLAVTVEVERVRHEVVVMIARARTIPVDDPGERAVIEGEHVVGVQVEVNEPARWKP
jgi:hypothetical protein